LHYFIFLYVRISKSKSTLCFILFIMLSGWMISSCKKTDEQASINTFLTGGRVWRLASMQVYHYNGDTLKRTDTLNTTCTRNQTFYFDTDGTCTYTNYSCLDQISAGTWKMITQDSLRIQSNMVCNDTTRAGSSKPFHNAQIINLGQSSLVLQDEFISVLRTKPVLVLSRKITRYAFIH